MIRNYRVKTIVTSSGERLPILLGRDGLPIFEATVFSLSEIRSRNRASNTIDSYLRSVMVFLLFLDLRNINLEERLNVGQLFTLGEIEDLVGICRLPVEKIHSLLDEVKVVSKQAMSSVVSLEKLRKTSSNNEEIRIDASSAATRLRNIRDYLKWLCLARISKHGVDTSLRLSLDSSIQYTSSAIDARLPSGSQKYSGIDQREGLEPEIVSRILEVVNPRSEENPWSDEHSKYRNELIILWLLSCGLRRGELLNIKISDLNFREFTVVVERRADDLGDPRTNQPKVKTRGREIPLSAGLMDKTNAYIMNHRSAISSARKHGFLFVASDSGAPLSIPSLNKIFTVLKNKYPEFGNDLFPHIMRHTWNDTFSEEMDKNRVGEEQEKKARSYLMGWSETSGTAATYTMSPCQIHMDCINCRDLVCIKGDAEKERRLRLQLDEAKILLQQAEQATKEQYYGSDRWLDHHKSTVERLSELLSIMDNPSVPIGAVIQLSPPKSLTHKISVQKKLNKSVKVISNPTMALELERSTEE